MADPTFANGKWTALKDPDDIRYYRGCVTKDLSDAGTTASSVLAVVAGVTIAEAATIQIIGQDTWCVVKLSGLDVTANALNFCTFRVTCANGEQFDRTIWFAREDH